MSLRPLCCIAGSCDWIKTPGGKRMSPPDMPRELLDMIESMRGHQMEPGGRQLLGATELNRGKARPKSKT